MTGTPLGTFGTVEHEVHSKRRGAIGPLFSKKAILELQPILLGNANTLCESMLNQSREDGEAETRANFLAYATDTINDHAFEDERQTESTRLIGNIGNMRRWRRTIAALALLTPIVKQFPFLIPLALKIPVSIWMAFAPNLGRIVALNQEMHTRAQKAICEDERDKVSEETGSEPQSRKAHNLFHSLLQSKLPDEERRHQRIKQEGVVVIAAGGETCARTMSFAIFFVLSNRDRVLPRLIEELRAAMPTKESDVDLRELEKLPWLTAIIKETLRLTALVVTRLPLVLRNHAMKYEDITIPAGNPISMTLIDVLHDPTVFPSPTAFRPERWLPESGEEYEIANRFYVPFSRGTRSCLGINMAYAMLYVVLGTLFRRFDLRLSDVSFERDIKFERDCFVGEPRLDTRGINVKLTPVET
ncbi:MAG: hypothetical protein M1828_005277 [Chrysothrix sp. TS-e1954]|nr:MAG: hypothetical protein M1828_005277 [Chrysothrix sp. TS-e1954]